MADDVITPASAGENTTPAQAAAQNPFPGDAAMLTPSQVSDQPMLNPGQGSDASQILSDQNAQITPNAAAYTTPPIPSETAPRNPDVELDKHESWMHHVLNVVGSILGGDTTLHVTKDKDGNVTVTHDPSTMGEKWGRVAAAALGGAAVGLQNSQGPGGLGKAAAAGAQYGAEQPQKRLDQANKEADVQQTQQLRQAQHILADQQIAEGAFAAKTRPVKWAQEQTDFRFKTLEFMDKIGGEKIAHTKNAQDLMAFAKANPGVVDDHMGTSGNTLVPVPDEKGEIDWYRVTPNMGNRRNPNPFTYSILTTDEKDPSKGVWKQITEPAGSDTINNQLIKLKGAWAANGKTQAQLLTNAHTQQETAASTAKEGREKEMQPYDIAAKQAATREANARAEQIRNQTSAEEGTPEQNAHMMVDGLVAPSQLSKRAKEYNAMLPLAQAYSLQKYGVPFNAETAEARYRANQQVIKDYADGKQADQIQTFNQFLGHASNLSAAVTQLRNTRSPLLNLPYNKLRTMAGRPDVAAILPLIEAVRTEYQNFLNNNHALHQENIREGEEMLDDKQGPAQMEAAVKAFAHTALIRTGTLNDRYKRAFQTDVPDLLNADSQKALQSYGLEGEMQRLLYSAPGAPQGAPGAQQQPGPAPVAAPPKPQPTTPQTAPDVQKRQEAAAKAGVPNDGHAYWVGDKLMGWYEKDLKTYHSLPGGR